MISVTDSAAAKVKELLEQEDEEGLALRVAVRPGGCSGFSYEMFFDNDLTDDDTKATFGQVQVVVDAVQRHAARGGDPRLQGRPQRGGLLDRQPQRPAHLRLRSVVQLTAPQVLRRRR